MQVVVNDILTSYSINGSGKVVLMIHGWGDASKTFALLEKKLSKNYQVICLDLPGFGATATPRETYSLQSYAEFIKNFLVKIDSANIFAIIGHSNGGAIALKALEIKSITAEKLILLASSGVRQIHTPRNKVIRLGAKILKIPTLILPKSVQLKIKKHVYRKIGSDLFVAENMQATFKEIISEDLINQASAVSNDTLLIYGDKDSATPIVYGEKFANVLINSRLEIIVGAGHFLHQTHANHVYNLIEDFITCHD